MCVQKILIFVKLEKLLSNPRTFLLLFYTVQREDAELLYCHPQSIQSLVKLRLKQRNKSTTSVQCTVHQTENKKKQKKSILSHSQFVIHSIAFSFLTRFWVVNRFMILQMVPKWVFIVLSDNRIFIKRFSKKYRCYLLWFRCNREVEKRQKY